MIVKGRPFMRMQPCKSLAMKTEVWRSRVILGRDNAARTTSSASGWQRYLWPIYTGPWLNGTYWRGWSSVRAGPPIFSTWRISAVCIPIVKKERSRKRNRGRPTKLGGRCTYLLIIGIDTRAGRQTALRTETISPRSTRVWNAEVAGYRLDGPPWRSLSTCAEGSRWPYGRAQVAIL